MTSVITWYDVLGVLPDAAPDDIRAAWQTRQTALQPGILAGAPPEVLPAADRARQAVQEAWRVLADPAARQSYDQRIGVLRPRRARKRSRIRAGPPGWRYRMSGDCSTARAWTWPAGSACTWPRSC